MQPRRNLRPLRPIAMQNKDVVIIGNGITGATAARHIRKLSKNARIRMISSETEYFFSRTALMYIYMGHMTFEDTMPFEPHFWPKNRIELIHDHVTEIDTDNQKLKLAGGESLDYGVLLLATGATYNKFGWPGQDLERVQGLYSYQDLQQLEQASQEGIRHAAIIGGGLIGIEFSEMLHTRGISSTFLVRESGYWGNILPPEESRIVEHEIAEHHIEVLLQTELAEIHDDGRGRVGGVTTKDGKRIDCDLVALTAGVHPNIDVVQASAVECGAGVLVDRWQRTNIPNVYAAGDCAQLRNPDGSPGRPEQLWYTGRMQAEAAANCIGWQLERGVPFEEIPNKAAPYERGIWFNSAKFFNVEYQTYGFVPGKLEAERTHAWTSPDQKKLVRLVWDESGAVTGMNFFGMRFSHPTCEQWLRDKRSAEYITEHLSEACFDPEFYRPDYQGFQASFRERFDVAAVR